MPSNYRNVCKLVNVSSHLHFLRQCRNNRLIPHGLRVPNLLVNTYNSSHARILAEKQSQQWLKLLINSLYQQRNYLQSGALFPLNSNEHAQFLSLQTELRLKKEGKFLALLSERRQNTHISNEDTPTNVNQDNSNTNNEERFCNLSDTVFSQRTNNLLEKGPSFCHGLRNDKHFSLLTKECYAEIINCNYSLQQHLIESEKIAELCGGLTNLLKQAKSEAQALENYHKSIKEVKKHNQVVVVPSDKTSRLICVNKQCYDEMLQTSTINTGNFLQCRNNMPQTRQSNFNKQLELIAKKYEFSQPEICSQLLKLKCSCPSLSSAYVLPKDHKEGPLKGRPIVAATDSPSVSLARFLSKELDKLLHYVPAHLRKADDLRTLLGDVDSSQVAGIASLDVVNLYGSIPRQSEEHIDMWHATSLFLQQHDLRDTFFSMIQHSDGVSLIKLALNHDFVLINGKCHTQSNGLSMGNALAPQIAIIYMFHLEQELLSRIPEILLWVRYIDDCLVVWKDGTNGNDILKEANKINPYIQFTLESPDNNGFLPFLDYHIKFTEQSFKYKLYIKPFRSISTTHWESNCPMSTKKNILLNELERAKRRSSDQDHAKQSIQIICNRFKSNGYPSSFIQQTIRQSERRLHSTNQRPQQLAYVRFPFTSEAIKRKVKSLIRRVGLSETVKPWFDCGPSLRRIFHPPKERQLCASDCEFCRISSRPHQCLLKNVIYRIDCQLCHLVYVGETKRQILYRLREHTTTGSGDSTVSQHFMQQHAGSPINIKWDVLHRGARRYQTRKTLEAIYIAEHQGRLMNGCAGRDIVFGAL